MISDFAVLIAILLMVFLDYMVGLDTNKLIVPLKFQVCIHVMFTSLFRFIHILFNAGSSERIFIMGLNK